MKRYKKFLVLHYRYINSSEGEQAIVKVFDDIFKRIAIKKKNNNEQIVNNMLTNV